MIASAYITGNNLHFYSEDKEFTTLGGIEYELGRPLLNFLCYESARFDEAFTAIASAFEVPGAKAGMHAPDFKSALSEMLTETQTAEPYVFFYFRALVKSIYADHAPRKVLADLTDDFRRTVAFAKHQIEMLLAIREKFPDVKSPMEYIYMLDLTNERDFGERFFLEKPFKAFYGVTVEPEIAELYEIDSIQDLLRFELLKMIGHNIFIKKCKNCEQFFIPTRRADVNYCDRIFADTKRRCNEIGALLRYEKKVAEDPVWEIYKRNYRRQNSRCRTHKLSQSDFLAWSEQAAQKRNECLAGALAFDDYSAWLEQGRIRKPRSQQVRNEK